MSAICNYSHPELQISEGLARQPAGSLFPYNPEFYDNVTGLYGPGGIYCWYLLLASNLVNWVYSPTDETGCRRPQVSNDFLAVAAYPMFAATDMTVQAIRLLGTRYRALAIFCLRFPHTGLRGFATFNTTQLDLRDIPPDILDLGQRVIDITGPMTVCYTFAPICLASVIWSRTASFRPTQWTRRLVYIAYAYTVLSLTLFHLSLGNLGISLILVLYETVLPFAFVLTYGCAAFMFMGCLGAIGALIQALVKRNRADILEALKTLGSLLLCSAIIASPVVSIYVNDLRLVPDLGIAVGERDQLATLIVGVVTICFTLYDHVIRWMSEERMERSVDGNALELQPLSSDVENGVL